VDEDALPDPPYNPTDEVRDAPEEKAPAKGKAGQKKLTAWQEETAVRLVALLQGEQVELLVDGTPHQITVPGVAQVVGKFDEVDAYHIWHGAPALSVALVKVAPRHPWLKAALEMSQMGGDYRELGVAVMGIVIPIAMHHGLFGAPAQPVIDQNGTGDDHAAS
jgi:hypothetical protein